MLRTSRGTMDQDGAINEGTITSSVSPTGQESSSGSSTLALAQRKYLAALSATNDRLSNENNNLKQELKQSKEKQERQKDNLVELYDLRKTLACYERYMSHNPAEKRTEAAAGTSSNDVKEVEEQRETRQESPDSNEVDHGRRDAVLEAEMVALREEKDRLRKMKEEVAEKLSGKETEMKELKGRMKLKLEENKKLKGRKDQLEEDLRAANVKCSRLDSDYTRLKKKTQTLAHGMGSQALKVTAPVKSTEREKKLMEELKTERTAVLNLKGELSSLSGKLERSEEDNKRKLDTIEMFSKVDLFAELPKTPEAKKLPVDLGARLSTLKKQRKGLTREHRNLKAHVHSFVAEASKSLKTIGESVKGFQPSSAALGSCVQRKQEFSMELAAANAQIERFQTLINGMRRNRCACSEKEEMVSMRVGSLVEYNKQLRDKILELKAEKRRLVAKRLQTFHGVKSTDPGTYQKLVGLCETVKQENADLKRRLHTAHMVRTESIAPSMKKLKLLDQAVQKIVEADNTMGTTKRASKN